MTEAPVGSHKPFASWGHRAGAYILDILPVIALTILMTVLFGEKTTTDNGFSAELSGGGAVVLYLGIFGWFIYNWIIKQGNTGQTLGKKQLGIAVYKGGTTTPLGPGMTFVRQLAHILDSIPCLIGYLFPLWDKERRTFADMVMGSRVYMV